MDKPSDTPAPHDYADKDFRQIYMCSCKNKGYSFGLKPKPQVGPCVCIRCGRVCGGRGLRWGAWGICMGLL